MWSRALIAALVLILVSAAYLLRIRSGMADFAVNYRAGQRMVAGETLYQTSDGHYMFKYLPSSALLYAPLGALPLEMAKPVWFALSLLALAGNFVVARGLAGVQARRAVPVLAGVILAKYILHELRLGQINLLVALVMLAGWQALQGRPDSRAELKAGALAGLAIALKPYAALVLAYLIVTQRWRGAAAAFVVVLAALALPAAFFGVDANLTLLRQWASTLSQSTPDLLTNPDNVSVIAFFTKWLGDPERALLPSAIVLGILAILTVAVIRLGRKEPRATVLEGALVLTLIPLVSPLGWDYTFVMSLLAVVLVLRDFQVFPAPARFCLALNLAVIGLALYDLMGRDAYAVFMQWSVTTVNFVVLVLALVYLRFRRAC
jgi:hypothetical protein